MTSVRPIEVPSFVLVILTSDPCQLFEILFDHLPYIVGDVVQYSSPGRDELFQEWCSLFLRDSHNREDVVGGVVVDLHFTVFQTLEVSSDGRFAFEDFGVVVFEEGAKTVGVEFCGVFLWCNAVAAADEGAGAAVGEELFVEVFGGDDGNGGGAGKVHEEVVDFFNFELRTVSDPWFF